MSQACWKALSISPAAADSEIMDGQDDMLSGCVCVCLCVSDVLPVLSPDELVNNDPGSGSCCTLSRWIINSHASGSSGCAQKKTNKPVS